MVGRSKLSSVRCTVTGWRGLRPFLLAFSQIGDLFTLVYRHRVVALTIESRDEDDGLLPPGKGFDNFLDPIGCQCLGILLFHGDFLATLLASEECDFVECRFDQDFRDGKPKLIFSFRSTMNLSW